MRGLVGLLTRRNRYTNEDGALNLNVLTTDLRAMCTYMMYDHSKAICAVLQNDPIIIKNYLQQSKCMVNQKTLSAFRESPA